MERKKIAFLDRDGTINFDKRYIYEIKDFEFLPGVFDGLKLLANNGFLLVIITNQSGIARGFYTENDYNILNSWMIERFYEHGIIISGSYYCPHLQDAQIKKYRLDCNCRKPKIGLFKQAIKDLKTKYDIDIKGSIAIGDRLRDLSVCSEFGFKGFLISDEQNTCDGNIYKVKNILEVAKIISNYK